MLTIEEEALDIARQVMETGGNPWEWLDMEWRSGELRLHYDGQTWQVHDGRVQSAGGRLGGAGRIQQGCGPEEEPPRKVGLWILRKAVGLSSDALHAFHNVTRAETAGFHPPRHSETMQTLARDLEGRP